jgi:transposase
MIGRKERSQKAFLVPGSIEDFIPEDHILKRVDKVLDLGWLRSEVKGKYCEYNGRPGIDPEVAVRLMLAGFFHGIVHDRKLMREAQVNLAIRWFAGYGMLEYLPDHSSLTRIRQRWGAEKFRMIFSRTVRACMDAGLVSGETVHADATLIRADVSWESITTEYADETYKANTEEEKNTERKKKKRSKTDPDATMTTSNKGMHMEPSYKQHTAVDDKAGVIVDVETTTGEASEGKNLMKVMERVEELTGRKIEQITADAGYAHPMNYKAMEERGTEAIIPPQKVGSHTNRVPQRLFKYDEKNDVVRCPAGEILKRGTRVKGGWFYHGTKRTCGNCRLMEKCVPASSKTRTILIVDGYTSLLRARRWRPNWDNETRKIYDRHRYLVEGVHGEAKTQHGLRRAIRRGLENVAIQVYLTAAAINLKRLAAHLLPILRLIIHIILLGRAAIHRKSGNFIYNINLLHNYA